MLDSQLIAMGVSSHVVLRDLIVRNHVKLGVSLGVLYCVLDIGYGLGRYLGDCRPALPKGRKCKIVKTQTESQVKRPVV